MLLDAPSLRPLYQAFRRGLITPVLTEATLDELRDVLSRPRLNIDPDAREEFLTVLRLNALWLPDSIPIADRPDPGDNAVLSAALTANAILVTGDRPLQRLHPFRNAVPILSPTEFIHRFLA